MKNNLYKITILNWGKYNKNSKPSMHSVMISKRFFDDHAIATLPAGGKLLYLGLLLRRGEDENTFKQGSKDLDDTFFIASHDLLLRYAGGSGQVVLRLLDLLQSFQLLRYEILPPLLNRIEKKGIERKVKEENRKEIPTRSPSQTKEFQELNKKIWEAYRESYLLRYKVDPVRNASVNSQISQLGKRLGAEAVEVVKFYLTHNDSFYLKQLHPIGLCLSNAESLRTQMLRGRAITSRDVSNFEKQTDFQSQIERIERGEL